MSIFKPAHFFLASLSVICASFAAQAETPTYLRLESRFASGQHPRAWLEARTKENQVQRWFRVSYRDKTANGKSPQTIYGWLPEDHAMTALKLSSITKTLRDEPDRFAPSLDSVRTNRIPKDAPFIVLEIQGSWARGRVLSEGSPHQDTWVLTEVLTRTVGNQLERGYTHAKAPMRVAPKVEVKPQGAIEAHKEISILRRSGNWVEIQIAAEPDRAEGTAWIERKNIWLASDIPEGTVRPRVGGLELRSAPLPYADIVTRLSGEESLKVSSTRFLRWGKVKVPEHGWLWWPISDEADDGAGKIPALTITAEDLVKRNLYDMALSEAVPGLRFASARGVFMSRDGLQWSMIPKFEDKNYPLAIAKNGPLFVGPYLSLDHGEKFDQWIRWETVVETIKKSTGSPPMKMRLSALETLDADGMSLRLTFDLGRSSPLKLSTYDRGASWRVEPISTQLSHSAQASVVR